GLLAQEMHGTDLVIARATAALFEYKNSGLISHEYLPNAFPEPDYEIKLGLDEREVMAFRSLFRVRKEIECAIDAIEKKNPKFMLMDGSLAPLPSDRPPDDSDIAYEYHNLIRLYRKLFESAKERKCEMVGVIKDSRAKRFVDIVRSEVDVRSSDSVFLSHLLREGERTFAFKYTADVKKHSILRDFGEFGAALNVMYLKPVEGDRPLRVEFFSPDFSGIASLVYSLSRINRSYAYPAVLIEADLRAALDPLELERAQKSLAMQSGFGMMPLRRNSRPFR
ncbi:MAG: DNA double-strand break repair nuclease NurA, partial [Candidatus ainarchaeum sp.]|nr:DNA double-strand break repair nuclease NurA [Candidatus ainarchaeum sp.]